MLTDEEYMALALEQANIAQSLGEVPVGAIIIDENGNIIAKGHNQPISGHDPTSHAEIVAIRAAAQTFANYRLAPKLTLFVTLEPCTMCAGAIAGARLARVVYGARDEKNGAIESGVEFFNSRTAHHKPQIQGGVLAEACGKILRDFFVAKRVG